MDDNDDIVEQLQNLMHGVPLTVGRDGWHEDEFRQVIEALKATTIGLIEALTGLEPQFKVYKLGDKANILVLLRNIKSALGNAETLINKALPPLEQDMCMAIADQGLSNFQTDTHTLSAKADAYLSKRPKPVDGEAYAALLEDLEVKALEITEVPTKALEKLCRMRLEDGEDLPPGCEVFIKASIGVRKRTR